MSRWEEPTSLDEAKRAAWDQDDWDEGVEHCVRMIEKAIDFGRFRYGQALDFGAGPARVARALANRHPSWRFVGYEPNAPMIDPTYYPMTNWLRPLPHYVAVYSTLVFQHLDRHDKLCALADITRVLNGDGIFRLQFVNNYGSGDSGPLSHPILISEMVLLVEAFNMVVVEVEDDPKYPTWSWLTARKLPR